MAETEVVAWGLRDWCRATSLSKAFVYELIAAGKVESVRVGGKRLITTSPREFVARHAAMAA